MLSNTKLPAMSGSLTKPIARVVSATPGRIRIRDRHLRSTERLVALSDRLSAIDGVLGIRTNPRIGSLVLLFDPAQLDIEKLEVRIEDMVDALTKLDMPVVAKARRKQLNRYAKIGMLGSLAASLALVATGQKRGHALAGALFVAGLGVHLGIHRQHLLR